MELVDMIDSKSIAFGCKGSSPFLGTGVFILDGVKRYHKRRN